jgi:Ca2+/Na+ antiporter
VDTNVPKLVIIAVVSTVIFIIQMSLIKKGASRGLTPLAVLLAGLMFVTAFTSTVAFTFIIHADVDSFVGILLVNMICFQGLFIFLALNEAKMALEPDERMTYREVIEQSLRR